MTDRPLHVCIVTPHTVLHGIGGMQQHTDDLARGLVSAGHEVTLLTSRAPERPTPPDGVRWITADAEVPSFAYDERWGRASALAFAALSLETEIDVIHSESAGALGLVRHGLTARTPMAVLFHGNLFGYAKAEVRAALASRSLLGAAKGVRHIWDVSRVHFGQGHWRAYRRFEAMVPSQAHLRDTIRSNLLRPERTHVVPNWIDVHAFRPGANPALRSRFGVADGEVVVMTLGRLASDKGTDRAIHALRDLPPEVRLVVVGSGPEESALRALAEETGVADRIRFAGSVAQADVPDVLRAADIFWFPTVRDEAAPLVMPQAMATGLPIVASAIGGIPECVEQAGVDAHLIPPGDSRALAAATRLLLADPAARAQMGKAARRRAVTGYSLEKMTAETVRVLRIAITRATLESAMQGAGTRAEDLSL